MLPQSVNHQWFINFNAWCYINHLVLFKNVIDEDSDQNLDFWPSWNRQYGCLKEAFEHMQKVAK